MERYLSSIDVSVDSAGEESSSRRKLVDTFIRAIKGIQHDLSEIDPPPGEGLEKEFRTFLRDRVFVGILGWPADKFRHGEVYDLYGKDLSGSLVLYGETKTPLTKLKEAGIKRFKEKLVTTVPLEIGFITNGHVFEAFRCVPVGSGIELKRLGVPLNLDRLCQKPSLTKKDRREVSEVLTPFLAENFLLDLRPFDEDYGRVSPSRDRPNSIELFSKALRKSVDGLEGVMLDLAEYLYQNRIVIGGSDGKGFSICEPLDDWSLVSARVPPSRIEAELSQAISELYEVREDGRLTPQALRRRGQVLSKAIGLKISPKWLNSVLVQKVEVKDYFNSVLHDRILDLVRDDHLRVYCRQTGYVLLSRMLLYRVCEDKQIVPQKMSGSSIDRYLDEANQSTLLSSSLVPPFMKLVDDVESLMRDVFYPHLYEPGLFDWWLIPKDTFAEYPEEIKSPILRLQRRLDVAIGEVLHRLNKFNLGMIERDVWKDVYQDYLSEDERKKLGGFYTPDEIVDLILDLVGYRADREGLCKLNLIDPACGSGTFLVEGARRLREHLDENMTCHKPISELPDSRDKAWKKLETIVESVAGIDIHPFATFLTEMNLLFLTIDLLIEAKKKDHSRPVPELGIACDDSLSRPGETIQIKLSKWTDTNHRAQTTMKDKKKADGIKKQKFDFVVGNPPWSGVLRGQLSPLFDDAMKSRHKKDFPEIAVGKYDIYVLFIYLGISWLKDGGVFGMITQNRFFTKSYGRGLRSQLRAMIEKKEIEPVSLLDLGNVGKVLFPRLSNYPAITVLRRLT